MENCVAPGLDKMWYIIRSCVVFNQSRTEGTNNSKVPQQKYRLGTVSIKILGGLNRFYRIPTSPSASVMAQNIQSFGPREDFLNDQ